MSKSFLCEECGCSYKHKRNLTTHLRIAHPTRHIPRTFNFKCEFCDKQYNQRRNFDCHMRNEHNVNVHTHKFKCPKCEYIALNKKNFKDHLTLQHQVEIKCGKKQFSSIFEFLDWKKEMEHNTKSSFIKKNELKSAVGTFNYYFMCSRSGCYVPRGKGKRHLKIQGSNKINGRCPAQIVVNESINDGTCSVIYTETHFGHQTDLGHINLTVSQRENLALKIQQKIPFGSILDDVRNSVIDSNLERIHLLTKKDLHNIRQSVKLSNENDYENFVGNIKKKNALSEADATVSQVSVKKLQNGTDINTRKENLRQLFNHLIDDIKSTDLAEKTFKKLKTAVYDNTLSNCNKTEQ